MIGQTLGHYHVAAKLGEGGMGAVYRARDTKLNRQVAIKVLPEIFASSPERVARFEREAQLLAALNHPNIAGIYGVEHAAGATCLVLELIEGQSLAARIATGAIPLPEALPIARQIADALEAAHDKGIIHRDLKPANIMLTADGHVKVLDFGLGKAIEVEAGADSSNSPTMTLGATQAGMLLGTAAYMSPEQAKGLAADKRADVWAFGCVLFEMLAGKRAFEGDDISETLASVLKSDPDWSLLPTDLPPAIRALVEGCLAKNRRARIAGMSAALFAIDRHTALAPGAGTAAATPGAPIAGAPRWQRAVPLITAALAATALTSVAWWLMRPAPPAALVARFPLQINEREVLFSNTSRQIAAVSPDGTRIVFTGGDRLYLRPLSELDARPIAGTESVGGMLGPVFSPDGREVAYWSADRMLKRVSVDGGVPMTVTPAFAATFGLDWDETGVLVGLGPGGVIRVSEQGGSEQLVTLERGEVASGPQLLPDRRHVLFTMVTEEVTRLEVWDKARIVAQLLDSGERTVLVEGASAGRYVSTGHLLYAVGGTVLAAPFDPDRLKVTGPGVPVIEGVRRGISGVAQFATSRNGVLVYVPGPSSSSSPGTGLALTDRTGVVEALPVRPGSYDYPRASPDRRQIAFHLSQAGESSVWVYDLSAKASIRRLTLAGNNRHPVWSGDSSRIAFQSDREGDLAIFAQRADGTGQAARLTKPEKDEAHVPESWSPDGRWLLFASTRNQQTTLNVLALEDGTVKPFGSVTSTNPTTAVFRPDGRWVAYSANANGTENFVFVQPFPATGEIYQVSQQGENGHHPMWTPDGTELLYVPQVGRLVAVTIATSPSFTFSDPVDVPRRFAVSNPITPRPWDIAPDGRVLSVYDGTQAVALEIRVVLNWFDELRARVPVK